MTGSNTSNTSSTLSPHASTSTSTNTSTSTYTSPPTNTRPKCPDDDDGTPPTRNYRGFAAGVVSGIAKVSVGHPFDTVKVRLQTSARFRGAVDCVVQTVRREGVAGLYKGATPPLVGWMVMDSLMLGSLEVFRRVVAQRVFGVSVWAPGAGEGGAAFAARRRRGREESGGVEGGGNDGTERGKNHATEGGRNHAAERGKNHATARGKNHATQRGKDHDADKIRVLPPLGHGLAGLLAGWTVSTVASPIEHIKARLQTQYAPTKATRLFRGPLDCALRIYTHHGLRGLYRGFSATLLFRSGFFFWWASYDVLSRALRRRTALSRPAVNFWAGGLSAQVFWLVSYPADLVKQRIMTDPMGGGVGDGRRRLRGWRDAAHEVYREAGWKGYWRGFAPCFLRAFPANAVALVAFEATMRALP